MLTRYEDIDQLIPHPGWHREQTRQLRLQLRTSLDGYLAVKGRMEKALALNEIQRLLDWELFPGLAARYELELAEELYVNGPGKNLGLQIGRMLGNDLKPGLPATITAIIQSSAARTFIQMYRNFVSVGAVQLTDVI